MSSGILDKDLINLIVLFCWKEGDILNERLDGDQGSDILFVFLVKLVGVPGYQQTSSILCAIVVNGDLRKGSGMLILLQVCVKKNSLGFLPDNVTAYDVHKMSVIILESVLLPT